MRTLADFGRRCPELPDIVADARASEKGRANNMEITVKDFLSKAWSKTDEIAIRNCDTEEQKPEYMAVMTARESWGNWIVDAFSMDKDVFGHSKCLHLWVYKA